MLILESFVRQLLQLQLWNQQAYAPATTWQEPTIAHRQTTSYTVVDEAPLQDANDSLNVSDLFEDNRQSASHAPSVVMMPLKQQSKKMPTNANNEPHRLLHLRRTSTSGTEEPVKRHESHKTHTTEITTIEKQREDAENVSTIQSDQSTADESIIQQQTEEEQRNVPETRPQSKAPSKTTPQITAQRKRFACADCTQLFDDRQTVKML